MGWREICRNWVENYRMLPLWWLIPKRMKGFSLLIAEDIRIPSLEPWFRNLLSQKTTISIWCPSFQTEDARSPITTRSYIRIPKWNKANYKRLYSASVSTTWTGQGPSKSLVLCSMRRNWQSSQGKPLEAERCRKKCLQNFTSSDLNYIHNPIIN